MSQPTMCWPHRRWIRATLVKATVSVILGTFVCFAGAGQAHAAVPSPTSGGWQLNGSSVLNSSATPPNLQLTPATNWLAGSAFWPTPVPGAGITAAFDGFIGSGSGADGMTLTLADASVTKPTALGVNGGGEGFSGITGIAVHHFVVTTTLTGLTVTMDGTQVLTYATSLPSYVLVGFTAATGGFNDI